MLQKYNYYEETLIYSIEVKWRQQDDPRPLYYETHLTWNLSCIT